MDILLLPMIEKTQVIHQTYSISKLDRNRRNGYNSIVIWLTGLSGSGKSTLANEIEIELYKQNISSFSLDGDNLRSGLNKDLTFTNHCREENIRRVAEVSKILMDSGTVVIAAFISPYEKDRLTAKNIIGENNFIEVYVHCPLNLCEERDVKGLYKKARNGEISNFTGISSPFEIPSNPDIIVSTSTQTIQQCCNKILAYVLPKLVYHE
jgi:adenylylsulfate kinase